MSWASPTTTAMRVSPVAGSCASVSRAMNAACVLTADYPLLRHRERQRDAVGHVEPCGLARILHGTNQVAGVALGLELLG